MIINGELQTGLGGGVCQVSTTVFNAAYEAGLPIISRTNHALYISHYPQGRDATVNYPDTDLRFVNDTGHWLLLRTCVGSSSLTVALYGTPEHRRVVSETAPLVVDRRRRRSKRIPTRRCSTGDDGGRGDGEPSRSTSVHRHVYTRKGSSCTTTTLYSSYRAEPKVVRVGTKRSRSRNPSRPETTTTTTERTTPRRRRRPDDVRRRRATTTPPRP